LYSCDRLSSWPPPLAPLWGYAGTSNGWLIAIASLPSACQGQRDGGVISAELIHTEVPEPVVDPDMAAPNLVPGNSAGLLT